MTETDLVLASIDETLDGYVTWQGSGDAMEWTAERPSEDEVEEILSGELHPSPLVDFIEAWMCDARFRLEEFQRVFLSDWESSWCNIAILPELLRVEGSVRLPYAEVEPPANGTSEMCWDDSYDASLTRTREGPRRPAWPIVDPDAAERAATALGRALRPQVDTAVTQQGTRSRSRRMARNTVVGHEPGSAETCDDVGE